MNTPFLLILDGMTGAGKSTSARLLADRIPRLAVIGMDRVKRFISNFERGEQDNAIARDVVFGMTHTYLSHGISVLIDQPFLTDEDIRPYEDLAQQYTVPIYKFQLYTTPEIAFHRVIDRQKDKSTELQVPEERIRRNIGLFAVRESKDVLCIDTSERSSEDVVGMILEKILV